MFGRAHIINTFIWGFALWLIGYVAGILLFFIVPKEYIGWIIAPLATLFTLWVLVKKIKRTEFTSYLRLGVIWVCMAVVLDYVFIVKFFNAGSAYYKADVFLYYFLTLTLPVAVGYWKFTYNKADANEV